MDVEKRSMGMNDYSGDIRKGGRGGPMSYRPAVSKEAAPGDSGSYYEKVVPPLRCCLSFLSLSYLDGILSLSLFFISSCDSTSSSWFAQFLPVSTFHTPSSSPLNLVSHWLVTVTLLSFDQSGLVPWRGGSLLSVLTTHCLQAPFLLQPHYSL